MSSSDSSGPGATMSAAARTARSSSRDVSLGAKHLTALRAGPTSRALSSLFTASNRVSSAGSTTDATCVRVAPTPGCTPGSCAASVSGLRTPASASTDSSPATRASASRRHSRLSCVPLPECVAAAARSLSARDSSAGRQGTADMGDRPFGVACTDVSPAARCLQLRIAKQVAGTTYAPGEAMACDTLALHWGLDLRFSPRLSCVLSMAASSASRMASASSGTG